MYFRSSSLAPTQGRDRSCTECYKNRQGGYVTATKGGQDRFPMKINVEAHFWLKIPKWIWLNSEQCQSKCAFMLQLENLF